jgi:hypothetical protein
MNKQQQDIDLNRFTIQKSGARFGTDPANGSTSGGQGRPQTT